MINRNKKICAIMLTLAMVVTSVSTFDIRTDADIDVANNSTQSLDLSGITVDCKTVQNITEEQNIALQSATRVIEGVTYNNYTSYTGLTAKASSIENDGMSADKAIDRVLENSRWASAYKDPQYIIVDLGNIYKLKDILIYWESASAKEYKVEVSADGYNFTEAKAVTSTIGSRVDDITFSSEIEVRAVKINCLSRNTAWGNSIHEIGLYGSDLQKEKVELPKVLSNLKVFDYSKYTGKYLINFSGQDGAAGYNVYVDDKEEVVKQLDTAGGYLTSNELEAFAVGTHTMYVASFDASGQELSQISTTFEVTGEEGIYSDIPQVYIYSNTTITTNYHDEADVSVAIIDKDGGSYEDIYDIEANIKIRGNTTSMAPKKPWNIKLSSKEKVLGMDKGKKWCLLANAFDKSLMRNKLVYDFGLENGVTYTSQSRFVEVYLNGEFQGNYLMTEPVEAKSGRVETEAYDADNNDILLELGTRNEVGVDHFTTDVLNTTFDVNDPEKGDDLTDDEVDAKISRVKTYLNNFENELMGQDYNEILNYIDEDTFVDFYIANELFKNVDFNFSSTRFYIKRDAQGNDKIYAGPLWDFDLSSGNCKSSYYTDYYVDGVSYKGYYCQEMNWYKQLLKNENFYNKIKEKYAKLQYVIQNIYKTDSVTELSIKHILELCGDSLERNYKSKNELGAGWSLKNEGGDGYSYAEEANWTTWEQPIEFLRDWLENRNVWLCEQWGVDMASAYEESKPTIPVEPETTTEEADENETTEDMQGNRVAAFRFDNTGKTAGEDMAEYAYEENDYLYKTTMGDGTFCASVNGENLKHIEWSEDQYTDEKGNTIGIVPIIKGSKSNLWADSAYAKFDFSTLGYSGIKLSVDVGGTKKAPANLKVVYDDEDGVEHIIGEIHTTTNKTMFTNSFDLPKELENKENVTIYLRLIDTTTIAGGLLADAPSSGDLAVNNFVINAEDYEEPSTEEAIEESTEGSTDDSISTESVQATENVSTQIIVLPTKSDEEENVAKFKSGRALIKKAVKKKSAKKASIKIRKVTGATGYQIKLSTSKKFKKGKNTITKNFKKNKFTVKKLKVNKKYYVKARAYKKVNGKKIYGKWSKVKKVKLK